MIPIRLGTRKSLLAWSQSSWVAREIERLNPVARVELVGIETQGDRILDVPLQTVPGKEFFVAEIDEALRSRQVDLTVHSMKDLSLERPTEFVLGAIPRSENRRDAVLFGPGIMEKLRNGEEIRIGTSSPRRIENIPSFLARALPYFEDRSARLEFVEIRGNVNTRLSRVHEAVNSPKHLDAVVLAFAGLIRLWKDHEGRKELERLLTGVRWMILPLRECPTAPAQGALAVECRKDDARVRELLRPLHDPDTEKHVSAERALLAKWGGGCHQKFGATSVSAPHLGDILYVRGLKPDGEFVDELRWQTAQPPFGQIRPFDGLPEFAHSIDLDPELPDLTGPVFVAHSRAVLGNSPERTAKRTRLLSQSRVWTSGVQSWFRLARRGVWVEGCAESFGVEFLMATIREPVLRLEDWKILTHEDASSAWKFGAVYATYQIQTRESPGENEALRGATHCYWRSGSQFDGFEKALCNPRSLHHSCGPGKTLNYLRSKGLNPTVFPSHEEWKKWLKSGNLQNK